MEVIFGLIKEEVITVLTFLQKAVQHPPKPNATSKYFSWDIPRNATTTVRKLPNCNTETPNKRRKLPERPSQYYTSLEVSVLGYLGIFDL